MAPSGFIDLFSILIFSIELLISVAYFRALSSNMEKLRFSGKSLYTFVCVSDRKYTKLECVSFREHVSQSR